MEEREGNIAVELARHGHVGFLRGTIQ